MEFRDIIVDPTALTLAQRILDAANLGTESDGIKTQDAYRIRTEAAEDLELVITIAIDCGETIAAPIADLLNPVKSMAYNVEKPKTVLEKTREIAKYAILGHILIGRLRKARARPFDVAMAIASIRSTLERLIDEEVTRKQTPGFQTGGDCECSGDCRRCGSKH